MGQEISSTQTPKSRSSVQRCNLSFVYHTATSLLQSSPWIAHRSLKTYSISFPSKLAPQTDSYLTITYPHPSSGQILTSSIQSPDPKHLLNPPISSTPSLPPSSFISVNVTASHLVFFFQGAFCSIYSEAWARLCCLFTQSFHSSLMILRIKWTSKLLQRSCLPVFHASFSQSIHAFLSKWHAFSHQGFAHLAWNSYLLMLYVCSFY